MEPERWRLDQVQKMVACRMLAEEASAFFKKLLLREQDKPLSKTALREHSTMVVLFRSAPGQGACYG